MRKNYLYIMLLFILALTGCSKNELRQIEEPQLYFEQSRYSMLGKELEVILKSTKPFSEETDVPFTPYVQENEDGNAFFIEQRNFHFKAGDSEAKLRLTKDDFKQDVKLYINCNQPPKGYIMGIKDYTIVNVEQMYYGYSETKVSIVGNDIIPVYLYNKKGVKIKLPESFSADMEVVPDKTTAREGIDYEFIDGKPLVYFKKNSNVGYLKIRKIRSEVGHNLLVLKMQQNSGIKPYKSSDVMVYITLDEVIDLKGKWLFKECSTSEKLHDSYYLDFLKFDDSKNRFEINFEKVDSKNYKMIPSDNKGLLSIYFNGPQDIYFLKSTEFPKNMFSNLSKKRVSQFIFPSVNYSFDKDKPVVKQANVYMIINDKGELQITINEYGPTNLMKDYFDFSMTSQDAPYDLIFSKQ